MIPRMTALIALLALLLSGPAFGAESLGGVPQTEKAEVVDAVADKQVKPWPPASKPLRAVFGPKSGESAGVLGGETCGIWHNASIQKSESPEAGNPRGFQNN